MSSLPPDVRHLAERGAQLQQAPVPDSIPIPVAVRATAEPAVQFAGRPMPPLQLHDVPSCGSLASVNVVADAYNSSSSGSSTCGGPSFGAGGGLAPVGDVPMPAVPTRRMREFIPESKKDNEYWMKRQKNNEAAKRSREKRRANDAVMMRRIHELATENKRLKLELDLLRRQLGLTPTAAEPQPPAAAAAPTDSAATQLPPAENPMTRHHKHEVPQLPLHCYDNDAVTTSSYHLTAACVMTTEPVRSEQNALPEIARVQYRHPAYHASANWQPTTCGVSISSSTSPGDAPALACRHSSSGNFLPSIQNLCGSALRRDGDGGPSAWSSYRSRSDGGHQPAVCRAPSPTPTPVDTAPIMIFSDVSSSDDSADETLYGRHVDTLTIRQSAERVCSVAAAVVESPLNLSTPSRHQSPMLVSHAYRDHSAGVHRRSSVDLAPDAAAASAASWLAVKTESERDRDSLVTGRAGCACGTDSGAPRAAAVKWLRGSSNGTTSDGATESSQWSRSSVAWQSDVDAAPPQPTDDEMLRAAEVDSGRVHFGLPLKVRRKMGCTSTVAVVMDGGGGGVASGRPCDGLSAGVTTQLWTDDRRSTSSRPVSTGTRCSASPDWFRPTTS